MFTEREDAVAFNFLFRVCTPVVLIILVAAACYGSGQDHLTRNLHYSIAYYICFRILFNVLRGRTLLLPWRRLVLQWIATLALSFVAYAYLISRKENLFPDLQTLGNEVWLAIIAYLYILADRGFSGDAGAEKRSLRYLLARRALFQVRFGGILTTELPNERWRRLVMSVLIVEDFNRPRVARALERALHRFGLAKTLGIMQVSTSCPVSDCESVRLGVQRLQQAYEEAVAANDWRLLHAGPYWTPDATRAREEANLVHATLVRYNPSGDYARDVESVYDKLIATFPVGESDTFHPDTRRTPGASEIV